RLTWMRQAALCGLFGGAPLTPGGRAAACRTVRLLPLPHPALTPQAALCGLSTAPPPPLAARRFGVTGRTVRPLSRAHPSLRQQAAQCGFLGSPATLAATGLGVRGRTVRPVGGSGRT